MKGHVTRQQAIELKKLGYNEKCLTFYNSNNEFDLVGNYQTNNELPEGCFSAPTLEQAITWFHSKDMFCSIYPSQSIADNIFSATIRREYKDSNNKVMTIPYNFERIKGYNEAQIVCLDTLLKLNKPKQ